MLGGDHRLIPECMVFLGSISAEIEGRWVMTLEKECPVPFTSKNTSHRDNEQTALLSKLDLMNYKRNNKMIALKKCS